METQRYRCNKCMLLEEKTSAGDSELVCAIPCSKCGGLAIKMPASQFLGRIFNELSQPEITQVGLKQ